MTDPFLSMKLRGNEMLKTQLEKLPGKVRQRVSRKALKESAEIIVEEAKANCPQDTGALRASIRSKVRVGSKNETAVVSAGDSDAWYAHLVEYGFRHTGHGRRGKRKMTSRGVVEGKSFMRNAIETRFEDMLDIFEETIADVVLEQLDKIGKGENK